jgi:hypothetical protein
LSLPTPTTIEPPRVVTRLTLGALETALATAVAPIPPDPFMPEGSAPMKLITVMAESTLFESAAVTDTPLSGEGANARQISEVPYCAFSRKTKSQFSPAPATLVTVVPGVVPLAEIKASSNSFDEAVEKGGELMLPPVGESCEMVTSTRSPVEEGRERTSRGKDAELVARLAVI